MIDLIKTIESKGYCTLTIETTLELFELTKELGQIISSKKNSNTLIDILTVTSNRMDKSLSSKYRDKAFPFHSDGAYLLKPPRYIILRSEMEIVDCPTILCSLALIDEDISTLKRDVWLVNGGRGKFYSSIISEIESKIILRFDQDCMRPVISNNRSELLMEEILKKSTLYEINWKNNLTLIIDNWKMLHARADASNSQDRWLQRIWIN